MASLLIGNLIEIMGGGVPSTIPACAGATFRLAAGYDLSAPQPVVDIVGELALDGERPFGRRASNRTITLPIVILAPTLAILAAARETLIEIIDQQTWTMTWTSDTGLPLVFDCFRANASQLTYSARQDATALVCQGTITFQALPYGRSDAPSTLSFASPVSGSPAPPPSPVLLDDYESVSGSHWSASSNRITGSFSAHWSNPNNGSAATYTSTFSATDLTGRGVLQHWCGISVPSGGFFWYYGSSMSVSFSYTLTDSSSRTLSFGTSEIIYPGNQSPNWELISANIPSSGHFDATSVVSCSISVTNYAGFQFNNGDVYLDDLTAQPVTTSGAISSLRGEVYTLHGITGTSHAPLSLQFEQPPASSPTVTTITATGAGTFIPGAGVTSLIVEKWAGGAPGGSRTTAGQATGGKGGEYTKNTAFACTPGAPVSYSVGTGGTASTTAPTDGGDTWFGANDSTAAHGAVAPAVNTTTASNVAHGVSTDPVAHAGGSPAGGATTGGGGGESGGPTSAGNSGGNPAGGTGQADAGDGGAGGASGTHAGSAGVQPGGGGGGASTTSASTLGGNGAAGQIRITWTVQQPPFQTLIAHRPGPDSPTSFTPIVTPTSVTDPPDGRQYPVVSTISGVNARFSGTYTVIAVANSWDSPSDSRTVTVTVYETEYTGGPSSSQSVSRTFTPSTDIDNGIAVIGELTIPSKDVAPDNTSMFHTAGITDTDTSDEYLDILFLDTQGQTVIVNETNGGYATYYLDEPSSDRDIGRVMGSTYGRPQAVSVLDSAFVSGGPLTVDPGDNALFCYAVEGAPALIASYSPRWFIDRLS